MKNVHVFLIKAANSLMSSQPGLITNNVGGLIQIHIVKKACLAKQEWNTDAYYLPLFITHSLICWPSNIPVGKHPNDNNIESNHQRSDIVEKRTSGD